MLVLVDKSRSVMHSDAHSWSSCTMTNDELTGFCPFSEAKVVNIESSHMTCLFLFKQTETQTVIFYMATPFQSIKGKL